MCFVWPISSLVHHPFPLFFPSQAHGSNGTTSSCAWHLCGRMQRFGPPCPWLAGETTPLSPSGRPARWTGGWHRPLCPARPSSSPSSSSASSSPLSLLSSPMSWSSSRSSLLQRRSRTLTPASTTVTTLRWNLQRWVRGRRGGEGKKALLVQESCQGQLCDKSTALYPLPGGNADLCRLLDSLDSLCDRVRGVCVWGPRLSAHPCVCHPHLAGQVLSHVQPHHLPGCGPEKLLRKILLSSGPGETQAF